ncbi:DsbA family protein [Jiella sonneratiae]|uniref:DsbA family protein n=1 Tax=Jiella sonneratiae TaxID=2816856 RepID=A0ABS3J150_9HYPH|nr:DsbA family protein [Jiella sonneratiae]MBO0903384.1 DsbA family protein [Jiella sonneratiae]
MHHPTLGRRGFLVGATAAFGAAAIGAAKAAGMPPDPTPQEVFGDPGAPVLGNPRGDVNLVEYFDFQCPYCKKIYPDVGRLVREDGNVRYLLKDWPIFGDESVYASQLTLAAGKYRPQALDALMKTRGRLTTKMIDDTLVGAGFKIAVLKENYRRDKAAIDGLLSRNYAQADGFGFSGTPAFVAGTVLFPGVPRMEDVKAALAKARARNHG